jgi:hypothetical protein
MIHLFSRTPEFVRTAAGSSEASVIIITLAERDVTGEEFFFMGDGYSCRTSQGWWQDAEACVDDVLLGVLGSDELAEQVG